MIFIRKKGSSPAERGASPSPRNLPLSWQERGTEGVRHLKRKKEIKPTIKNYEDFFELLIKQGSVFLEQNEPNYCNKFRELEKMGMDISKIQKKCNKLLNGKLNNFVELVESLSEVGYYWKRITEVYILLETDVPYTPIYELNEASWFVYNCDFFWHSAYSLEERLMRFLKKFKRMYRSPSTEETKYLDGWVKYIDMMKNKITKQVRDPLAHVQSRYVDIWHEGHFWEAKLIRKDFVEFIDLYEGVSFGNRDIYNKYLRELVLDYLNTLSFIFNQLCTFSLHRLELK